MKTEFTIGLWFCILLRCIVESKDVFVVAPNVFRLGAEENIALAIHGTANSEKLDVYIKDHPGKKRTFASTSVILTPGVPKIEQLRIKPEDVEDIELGDPNNVFYVSLIATGVGFHKEIIIPLSIKSGYMYLQTDKPIYRPKQKVQFRIIPLSEETRPSNNGVRLQIRNPTNTVIRDTLYSDKQPNVAKTFITPDPFTIAAQPMFGNWSATVLYGYKFQQNITVPFEVARYVLPTFKVKLEVDDVILPTTKIVTIRVDATYLYGKPVTGFATFRLGVKGPAPEAIYFGVADYKQLRDGKYTVHLNTSYLEKHENIKWFPNIEGFHLIIEATVTDSATGLKEIEINSHAIFTSSPLAFSFKRSLKDFKPGLVSVIEADLTYVSGRPASGIKTVLTGTANRNLPLKIYSKTSVSDDEGRIWFEIHPEIHHTVINVMVKTEDPDFGDQQAVGHHTQNKFTSKKNAYIAINRRSSENIKPGKSFSEDIYIENSGSPMTDIYFVIISRGRINTIKKLPSGQFKNPRVEFLVTHDMAPNFRIMVFGHCNGELIADSRRVDVTNDCDPKANVEIKPEFSSPANPGNNGQIIFTGNKGTSVGILAVDTGVYALSKKGLLTKKKMFNTLASHDLGCGSGGGLTTEGVLGNAGVVILSNFHSSSAKSSCKEQIRRKRDLASTKLDEYSGRLRQCCMLGMQKDKHTRTCEQRINLVKTYIKEDAENCSKAFLDCCYYNKNNDIEVKPSVVLPREGDASDALEIDVEDEIDIEKNVNVRKEFRETWIFTDIIIGPQGQTVHEVSLPHSITTWVIQAVSVSPNNGMCVADPKELKVTQKVFIQLNLPYSVVRNEQVEIKATVFNYGSEKLMATVYMFGVKDICSGFKEGERSEKKKVTVNAYSAQTVTFPIIPLKEGNLDIKVAALSYKGSDIIIRQLNVVPEGIPVETDIPIVLDPTNQQKRKKRAITTDTYSDTIDDAQSLQVTTIKLNIPEDAIPGTESCVISAIGDQFGPTVDTCLEHPDSLLSGPSGCAEQNMIHFAPTLYTMRYLKAAGKISADREEKGYNLIRKGYEHQLTFRKPDGSFGAWIGTPSSVWLTAFVTRVFCEASDLVYIDPNIMCQGVTWLVNKQNPADGSFIEDHPVYHKDLMGGVVGQAPLTAYILLTLEACKCNIDTTVSKARAVDYLENTLNTINGPSATSVVAYALAVSNSEKKFIANDKLLAYKKFSADANTLHWSGSSAAASVEATSYALLTQLRLNDMITSNSIVNWLNTQRFASGKFQSTQDTIVALHALSEYAIKAKMPSLDLRSELTSSNNRDFHKTFSFDERNAQLLQQVDITKLGGMLFVHTTGNGVGSLSVKMRYNIPTPPEKLCKFDVKVKVNAVEEKFVPREDVNLDIEDAEEYPLLPIDLKEAKRALEKEPNQINFNVDPRARPRRSTSAVRYNDTMHVTLLQRFLEKRTKVRTKRANDNKNLAAFLDIQICVKYLGNNEPEMSIVDVGIFSGYIPTLADLTQLVKDKNGFINRYEVLGKGIIFYLGQVPRDNPYCFSFKLKREYMVRNTQTSAIQTYDYYNREESCTVFYSPDNNSPILRKVCSDGICQCAEGGCPPKNPFFKKNRGDLLLMACEDHDYVWKVKVIDRLEKKDGFFRMKARVMEIFKTGIEDSSIEGETRTFMARENCESATLMLDREYIIMGKDGEKYKGEDGVARHRYLLDKSSAIQMWIDMKDINRDDSKTIQRYLIWLSRTLKDQGCQY